MFIRGFQRTINRFEHFLGADRISTNYSRGSFYNDWGIKLKSLTNIDGLFSLRIDKGYDDLFWSIYEVNLISHTKNFVAKFEKLNEAKAFLQKKYEVALS